MIVAALVLGALAPPTASASVVELRFDGTFYGKREDHYYALVVRGDPGEANRIVISQALGSRFVKDAGAPLRAGQNCVAAGEGVSCTLPSSDNVYLNGVRVELGDGDDTFDADWATQISGGPGDDRLLARTGYPLFDGGPGADLMQHQDPIIGGQVTYHGRAAPVSVSFDGVANDGEAGEGDDVEGVFRTVIGGEGADTLAASSGTDGLLYGLGGHDRLIGGDGDDELVGGPGDDMLLSGAGNDSLDGGAGADLLSGGPGSDLADYRGRRAPLSVTLDDRPDDGERGERDDARFDLENVSGGLAGDVIVGSAAPNGLDGGAGDDALFGGEGGDGLSGGLGADVIDAGPGADVVLTDGADRVGVRDGERDALQCSSAPPARLRADRIDVLLDCPTIDLDGGTVRRVTRRSTISLDLTCRGRSTSPACRGSVSIRPPNGEEVWAKRDVKVPVGERRRVTLSLRPEGRGALAGQRSTRARLVLVTRYFAEGPSAVPLIRRLVLRPPVRRR